MSEKRQRTTSDDSSSDSQKSRDLNASQRTLKCSKCSKQFENVKALKQHLRKQKGLYRCNTCQKSYTRRFNLHKHQKKVHNLPEKVKHARHRIFICEICGKKFDRHYNFVRHKTRMHEHNLRRHVRSQFSCRHCDSEFETYESLFQHVNQNHPLHQRGGRAETSPRRLSVDQMPLNLQTFSSGEREGDATKTVSDTERQHQDRTDASETVSNSDPQLPAHANEETALRRGVVNRYLEPTRNQRYDALVFLAEVRDQVRIFLQSRADDSGGIKWNLCLHVEMRRYNGEELLEATPFFRSRTYVTLTSDDFSEHDFNESMQKMYASLEKFLREGSGWYVNKVLKLEIHTIVYKPLGGSSYLLLPKSLSRSNSLLNIMNHDDKCFLYCLIASLHPMRTNPSDVRHYIPYQREINMKGITYPVTLSQIRKIEAQNENISINVYTYDDDAIVPLRITDQHHRLHNVNLLWLRDGNTTHYCLITDLNRFLSRTKSHQRQMHFCPYGLHGFRKRQTLDKHINNCSRNGPQRVELPVSGENDVLRFTSYEQTLEVAFVIYCDYETILSPLSPRHSSQDHSSTVATTKLEVCGFAFKVVCQDDRYTLNTVAYRGQDAGKRLIERLLTEEKRIKKIVSKVQPMHLDIEQTNRFENAIQCCLCKSPFPTSDNVGNRKVRHHDHLTGRFIGAACNNCNLQCKQATHIPVIFHNLKSFDAHIVCQNLGYFKDQRLSCIAQNSEKYISFSLSKLRFIDSLQFLSASLETLVDDLKKDGLRAFPHLLSEFSDPSQAELLLRKGVYPYEYMDSFEKFEEAELPPKERFYSSLKKENISDADYTHAQKVYETFNMTCLGDYHDLYVKSDVILLADVFQSFRKVCLEHYELDPSHYYTAPGLSWAACLKMSGVRLELLTDIDQILMVEAGIRGGCSQVSNRYKKANNPYLPDYDNEQPTTYLQYLDANNLYAWSMIQALPTSEFAFMKDDDIETLDILNIPEDGETGYILEVSLEYPVSLHDEHNCLPLAPVKQKITADMLSPYSVKLLRKLLGLPDDKPLGNAIKSEKLLTTLEDKDHYVLHYRTLQLYLNLGMVLKSVHRILKFKQEAWMKPYIEYNTRMRQMAESNFQKSLYKLLNVSVFGKTMENVRRHRNIELIHTERRLEKVAAKPTYKTSVIFNEDLVAVELHKNNVKLFKPIYCGMSILDLSKVLMYDFWYGYLKRNYGDRVQLQMTDTDSLLFSCETEDIYRDMMESSDYFDTSEYPKEHFLYSQTNRKVLGKFKDETKGNPISQFVGLRSKMYSFICDKMEVKKAKGVSKVTVAKDLKHSCYEKTLFEETSKLCSMTALRSHAHELFSEDIRKIGLSAYDDKRYYLNAVESYAYGHHKIAGDRQSENCH